MSHDITQTTGAITDLLFKSINNEFQRWWVFYFSKKLKLHISVKNSKFGLSSFSHICSSQQTGGSKANTVRTRGRYFRIFLKSKEKGQKVVRKKEGRLMIICIINQNKPNQTFFYHSLASEQHLIITVSLPRRLCVSSVSLTHKWL